MTIRYTRSKSSKQSSSTATPGCPGEDVICIAVRLPEGVAQEGMAVLRSILMTTAVGRRMYTPLVEPCKGVARTTCTLGVFVPQMDARNQIGAAILWAQQTRARDLRRPDDALDRSARLRGFWETRRSWRRARQASHASFKTVSCTEIRSSA